MNIEYKKYKHSVKIELYFTLFINIQLDILTEIIYENINLHGNFFRENLLNFFYLWVKFICSLFHYLSKVQSKTKISTWSSWQKLNALTMATLRSRVPTNFWHSNRVIFVAGCTESFYKSDFNRTKNTLMTCQVPIDRFDTRLSNGFVYLSGPFCSSHSEWNQLHNNWTQSEII